MTHKGSITALFLIASLCLSEAQNKLKNETKMNPLLCDPISGMCAMPEHSTTQTLPKVKAEKLLTIIYFTDPICSSCWGIEPQLKKLKLEYGDDIKIDYRMGGLLKDWSYNSGGISKPSDVAHHWDEVSVYYDMPIDGDVWLEDPLSSSYPPSIAFKAAQLQDDKKSISFLREMREMVFLKKKNIAKWDNIAIAAKNVGLDVAQLKMDFEGKAKHLFEEDLKLAQQYSVRGFPTMIFLNEKGENEIVYGSKPYPFYETAVLKILPDVSKEFYDKTWGNLFSKYHSLTAKEFAELSGIERSTSEVTLNKLTSEGKLEKLTTKNGSLWTIKTLSR